MRAAGLDPAFSLYLDLVRIAAACAVVMAHFGYFCIFDDSQIARVADLGRESVIAFFVLSGFVIAYSAEQRNPTLRDYAVARCARLYSVVLPVLLLAFLLAGLAEHFGVQVGGGYQLLKPWLYIPFHLLFLGELWGLVETPPWLLPYWSLNYEAWYYVLFGAVFYLRGRMRLLLGVAVFALMGPRLWLLLPLWMSGVFLYRWQKTHVIARGVSRAGWALTLALLALWAWYDPEYELRLVAQAAWPFTGLRMGSADRVLADYIVGVLVLANFACARHARFSLLPRAKGLIRFLSAHTFTLYLSHSLVICCWQAFVPFERGAPLVLLGLAIAVMAGAAALQPLTEDLQRRLRAQRHY